MHSKLKKLLTMIIISMALGSISTFVLPAMAADKGIVVFGETYSSTITDDTYDQYIVELEEPGRLSVNITNGTFSTSSSSVIYVKWYDSNDNQISTGTGNHSFAYTPYAYNASMDLEAGTYYVRVQRLSTYTGAYNLTATFTPANNTDWERGLNRNVNEDDAYLPMFGEQVRGFISHQNNENYYSFELEEPGRLTVNITNGTFSTSSSSVISVKWYDSNDNQISTGTGNHSFAYTPYAYNGSMNLEKGTYYICVQGLNTYTGTYNLTATFTPAHSNEEEPNNDIFEGAQQIKSGQLIKGFISYQDDIDLYKVEVTKAGQLSLNITNDTFNTSSSFVISITCYNSAGNVIAVFTRNHSFGTSNTAYNSSMNVEPDTYYVRIDRYNNNTGAYFLKTTFPSDESLSETWYTVTYNANGGSGAPTSRTKMPGVDMILSNSRPTRDNFSFLGWATGSGASTVQYQSGGVYSADANLTLYAVWEAVTGAPYEVTYNGNSGLGAPNKQTKTHGVAITLSNTQPTRTNYNFLGWATSSTATIEEYYSGGSYTADASANLYAVWHATASSYKITYDANGGSGEPSQQTKTHGASMRLSSIRPVRDGFIFLGWARTATATAAQYMPGTDYNINAERTLYAVWKDVETSETYYDITASDDGNGTAGASITSAAKGVTIRLTATPNDGYRFKEWRIISGDILLSGATDNPAEFIMTDSDVEVKAIFELIQSMTYEEEILAALAAAQVGDEIVINADVTFYETFFIPEGVVVTVTKGVTVTFYGALICEGTLNDGGNIIINANSTVSGRMVIGSKK